MSSLAPYGQLRVHLGEVCRALAPQKASRIEEGPCCRRTCVDKSDKLWCRATRQS